MFHLPTCCPQMGSCRYGSGERSTSRRHGSKKSKSRSRGRKSRRGIQFDFNCDNEICEF